MGIWNKGPPGIGLATNKTLSPRSCDETTPGDFQAKTAKTGKTLIAGSSIHEISVIRIQPISLQLPVLLELTETAGAVCTRLPACVRTAEAGLVPVSPSLVPTFRIKLLSHKSSSERRQSPARDGERGLREVDGEKLYVVQ